MNVDLENEDDQINDLIKVEQYIIDIKGQKIAVIIDIEEFGRLKQLIKDINEIVEDISGIHAIEERKSECDEDYKSYSDKRKARLHVQSGH